MPIQRTSVRLAPTTSPSRRAPVQQRAVAAPAPAAMRVATTDTELEAFKNRVIKSVSYAQQAQAKLEEAGRAYNAGTIDRAAFQEAEAAFKLAVTELRGLQVEGKRHNAPFWRPSGFKIDRFYRECGAQALLDYRPPTLGVTPPAPTVPDVFALKLASLKKAADDAVNPEAGLTALLTEARTVQQVDQILEAGRKGHRIAVDLNYWNACSQTFFAKAHARRDAIAAPATLADKLESVRRAASDTVSPEAGLVALLPEVKTLAEIDQVLDVARKGSRIALGLNYWNEGSPALFAKIHARREAIAPPATFDEKLKSIQRAASDTVSPEPALLALLGEAETPAQIEQIRQAGRKGHRIAIDLNYWTECSQALFAATYTRELQMELAASVPTVSAPDRVKFALQPLPTFDAYEPYRNYAVKSAAYALVEMSELRAARAAFKAGKLTERQLHEIEDRLELSLKLVSALQAHVKPGQAAQWRADGFDVQAFWDKYQIAASAKQLLG
jgi:hypothetical protein